MWITVVRYVLFMIMIGIFNVIGVFVGAKIIKTLNRMDVFFYIKELTLIKISTVKVSLFHQSESNNTALNHLCVRINTRGHKYNSD